MDLSVISYDENMREISRVALAIFAVALLVPAIFATAEVRPFLSPAGVGSVAGGINAQVFPRVISPNGDGINDRVFFYLENPTDEIVQGAIYDVRMIRVATPKISEVFAQGYSVYFWNGMSDSGAVVDGGVYLYRMEVGNKVVTGTVAVVK